MELNSKKSDELSSSFDIEIEQELQNDKKLKNKNKNSEPTNFGRSPKSNYKETFSENGISKLMEEIDEENDVNKENRLKDIISYLNVQRASIDEKELSRMFHRLDADGNESISPEEIKIFFNSLRTPVNEYYIEKLLKNFDLDNDGDIQKSEFIKRMKLQENKGNTSDLTELLEIFKLFDANHDNKICDQDLQNILKALGEKFQQEECEEMMKYLTKGKGSLSFAEFFQLVKDEGIKEDNY